MKKKISIIGLSTVLLLFGLVLLASHVKQPPQPLKTAYANETFILSSLPEARQIEADLRAYEKQLQSRLKVKMDEFQVKSQDFQQNYQRMTDLERADKQEELASMQESVIKFQRDAEASIQEKQQKLLLPVIEKIQKVIHEIGAAGVYSYIFKAEGLLYAKNSKDISLTILKRLGVDTSKLNLPGATGPNTRPPAKGK